MRAHRSSQAALFTANHRELFTPFLFPVGHSSAPGAGLSAKHAHEHGPHIHGWQVSDGHGHTMLTVLSQYHKRRRLAPGVGLAAEDADKGGRDVRREQLSDGLAESMLTFVPARLAEAWQPGRKEGRGRSRAKRRFQTASNTEPHKP